MIQKIEVSSVHAQVDDDLHKYAVKKIGNLDKYLSRHARQSAHAEVKLKESKAKNQNRCQCEVILHLPKETIATKETTINMYAAIDIVETKLKNQLKKYKETHEQPRFGYKLIRRLRRSGN